MPATTHPTAASLLWFRNDLRLADHAALRAAATEGPVLPVYVLDEEAAGRWAPGGASRWWLHHSLAALDLELRARGTGLVLRRGPAVAHIPALARAVGARAVHTGGGAEPWARQLDRQVADALAADGIVLRRHRTMTLFNPDRIRTGSGGTYTVFTAFARACRAGPAPPPPQPAPARLAGVEPPDSDRLEDWALLPRAPDWAGGMRAVWTPGEDGARRRMDQFLASGFGLYAARRDHPGEDGTSMLSPHLAFGELSPAQVWHAAGAQPDGPNGERFMNELLWREFCRYLLWFHPDLPEAPLRPAFARMAWRDDPRGLVAWQRGRSGLPIVDAGMRQLWRTGWMHNRVRMIVASFLVKHLLLPWQAGEAWFWDTLVDADLASNSANWQWVAGSGADAAPYFRVFNPVLQGRKFDPDGAYVRHFVPELRTLDARFVHAPWEAPEAACRAAGIVLGRDYPRPVVDLAAGRARALAAFAALRTDNA
jgi:deoxyribodipyrimidine photo-lyase